MKSLREPLKFKQDMIYEMSVVSLKLDDRLLIRYYANLYNVSIQDVHLEADECNPWGVLVVTIEKGETVHFFKIDTRDPKVQEWFEQNNLCTETGFLYRRRIERTQRRGV